MDLSKLPNPYDFANPVSNEELFIGRKQELEEIDYYLNHADIAARPINLALIGERASGKTSLLNMISIKAKRKKFCVVRIDLDEGDTKSQLVFFNKIFDNLLSEACDLAAFGGKQAKTYDVHLDIVNTYSIPENKEFCPFLFPIQYAKAMSAGNIDASLSDQNFKNDIMLIRNTIGVPIVLLFDECNALCNNRIILEKLRNIFMNMPGFMIVLAGTLNLFPVMDDVFSPIIRQFKKINVIEFKDREDTKDCIQKPLEKIGVKNPLEIFDLETYQDIREIHELSGGRPYEIQLICHFSFRRVQEKRAKKMKIDLSVLEDVRKQLELSQDIGTRPLLGRIRSLTKEQLSALNILCGCEKNATFEQLWIMEYLFKGEKNWTRESLLNELNFFVKENILRINNGIIEFCGDEFDKIYTKYFAREQKINLRINDRKMEVYWGMKMMAYLNNEKINNLTELPYFIFWENGNTDLFKLIDDLSKDSSGVDDFVEGRSILAGIYELMILYKNEEKILALHAKVKNDWLNLQKIYFSEDPDDDTAIQKCLEQIGSINISERFQTIGGIFEVEKVTLPVIPVELLKKKVIRSQNEKIRSRFANYHLRKMESLYMKKKSDNNEILFHANMSYEYNPHPKPFNANNLGYFYLIAGDFNKAQLLFEEAIGEYGKENLLVDSALSNYNLGILKAITGDINSALDKMNLSFDLVKNEDRGLLCVLVPKLSDSGLKFEERKNIKSIKEIIEESINVLNKALS